MKQKITRQHEKKLFSGIGYKLIIANNFSEFQPLDTPQTDFH